MTSRWMYTLYSTCGSGNHSFVWESMDYESKIRISKLQMRLEAGPASYHPLIWSKYYSLLIQWSVRFSGDILWRRQFSLPFFQRSLFFSLAPQCEHAHIMHISCTYSDWFKQSILKLTKLSKWKCVNISFIYTKWFFIACPNWLPHPS